MTCPTNSFEVNFIWISLNIVVVGVALQSCEEITLLGLLMGVCIFDLSEQYINICNNIEA